VRLKIVLESRNCADDRRERAKAGDLLKTKETSGKNALKKLETLDYKGRRTIVIFKFQNFVHDETL